MSARFFLLLCFRISDSVAFFTFPSSAMEWCWRWMRNRPAHPFARSLSWNRSVMAHSQKWTTMRQHISNAPCVYLIMQSLWANQIVECFCVRSQDWQEYQNVGNLLCVLFIRNLRRFMNRWNMRILRLRAIKRGTEKEKEFKKWHAFCPLAHYAIWLIRAHTSSPFESSLFAPKI